MKTFIPENIITQFNELKNEIIDVNQSPIILNNKSTYGKFLFNGHIYVYEINLIPIKIPVGNKQTYYFIELKGVKTLKHNDRNYEQDNINDYQSGPNEGYNTYLKTHFPNAKIAKIDFYNITEREDEENLEIKNMASCIIMPINISKNIGLISNMNSQPQCNLPHTNTFSQLSGIFLLRFLLLKHIHFNGPLLLADNSFKDGKRMALYYMKKYNDPKYLLNNGFNMQSFCKFSKYQDYGFEINDGTIIEIAYKPYKERLLELIYIKLQCRTLDINDYDELENKYSYDLNNLLFGLINNNYDNNLRKLLVEYKQSYSKKDREKTRRIHQTTHIQSRRNSQPQPQPQPFPF